MNAIRKSLLGLTAGIALLGFGAFASQAEAGPHGTYGSHGSYGHVHGNVRPIRTMHVQPRIIVPQYQVYYRSNCNAPWIQYGCSYDSYAAAQVQGNFYRSRGFEFYIR